MFMFHAALALNLLALCAGSALFLFAASHCDCKGSCFAKIVAVIVLILAILSTVCTVNSGRMMWNNMQEGKGMMMSDNNCPMCDMKSGNSDKPTTTDRAATPDKPAKNGRHH